MIEHTHDKTNIASRYGRLVVFMTRPEPTDKKQYREPVIAKRKWFLNATLAKDAKEQWEKH